MADTEYEIVAEAAAYFGVADPAGAIVQFAPGDPLPAWAVAKIAASNARPITEPDEDPFVDAPVAPLPTDPPFEPGTDEDPRLAGAPPRDAVVEEIVGWVDGDPDRAEAAFEREQRRARPRKSLVDRLAAVIDGDDE